MCDLLTFPHKRMVPAYSAFLSFKHFGLWASDFPTSIQLVAFVPDDQEQSLLMQVFIASRWWRINAFPTCCSCDNIYCTLLYIQLEPVRVWSRRFKEDSILKGWSLIPVTFLSFRKHPNALGCFIAHIVYLRISSKAHTPAGTRRWTANSVTHHIGVPRYSFNWFHRQHVKILSFNLTGGMVSEITLYSGEPTFGITPA